MEQKDLVCLLQDSLSYNKQVHLCRYVIAVGKGIQVVVGKGIQVVEVQGMVLVQDFGIQVKVYTAYCIGHIYKDCIPLVKASGNTCKNKDHNWQNVSVNTQF